MKKIDRELEQDLLDLLKKYSELKDFSPGEFVSKLNKFAMRLNYDMTEDVIAATGLLVACFNHVLTDLKTEEVVVFDADEELIDEINTKETKH
jgi:hypothetical protein